MRLFIIEGLLLGLIGGIAGVVIGFLLAKLISSVGIPMPPPPGMDVGFTGKIQTSWNLSMGALALAIITTLVGSIYPAWKASRMEIVDALRHNH